MGRIISTPQRFTPSINKAKIPMSSARLSKIKECFDDSLQDIRIKFSLIDALMIGNPPIPDEIAAAEALMRSQIVFLESTLDYYLHELWEYGLTMMFNDEWDRSEYYYSLKVKMKDVEELLQNSNHIDWFSSICIDTKKTISFLSNDQFSSILKALEISEALVASNSGFSGSSSEQNVKNMYESLNNISGRRNAIVHKLDMLNGIKQGINVAYVSNCIDTVEKIVSSIHTIASNK